MGNCDHTETTCLNHFEFIRKYRCALCDAVMMCACDEVRGTKLLPHQLGFGTEFETQERIPVTEGFRKGVCRECRGLEPEAQPVASIYGRTSKLKRYYWREIWFRTQELREELLGELSERQLGGETGDASDPGEEAERRALAEIRRLHELSPKFTYVDPRPSDVLAACEVSVRRFDAVYVRKGKQKKALVQDGSDEVSVEDFVARRYGATWDRVLRLESRPFHVLFGVFVWLLIQSPFDENNRLASFGARDAYEVGETRMITTFLPSDFGTPGYGRRRAVAIDEHFETMLRDDADIEWLFDYWLEHSEDLRQYLWAHQPADVQRARDLVDVLPWGVIRRILRYLVDAYWERFCGWPDLLAVRGDDFLFVEVKSSGDRLSEDQLRWIQNNHSMLNFPFELAKVHRSSTVT